MAIYQNPNDPNAQDDQNAPTGPNGAPLQTIGTAAPAGQNTTDNGPARPQPQGSGRFTNIQKYLQANKAGGQRITQQVGTGLEKQFGEQSDQAQKYYKQLGQSVNQANQVAQAGANYQQQLKDIGSQIAAAKTAGFDQRAAQDQNLNGIQQFVQQPGFQQFQDIQTGRGIDENLLALQQQRAMTSAQRAAQGSQQAQAALGTEGGRFEMLRKAFGGDARSGYNQGQQRLDQVLLGQGGGLGQLQAKTTQQAQADARQQQMATDQLADVNRIAAQERGLIGDIGSTTSANEQAYMNMLGSYIDPLNKQRSSEVEDFNRAIQSYKDKGYTPGFNQAQMTKLGLTNQNQGVYNVFNDINNANDIATIGGQAQSAQDVANKQDVARYQALAKMIGKEYVPQITKESNIGNAYTAKVGEAGLAERLANAEQNWQNKSNELLSGNVYGPGADESLRSRTYYNAAIKDLINKGRSGVNYGSAFGEWGYMKPEIQNILLNQLSNTLKQQNYNRTLGGRRETILDTEAKKNIKSGIGENFTPITGTDPSLKYKGLK